MTGVMKGDDGVYHVHAINRSAKKKHNRKTLVVYQLAEAPVVSLFFVRVQTVVTRKPAYFGRCEAPVLQVR